MSKRDFYISTMAIGEIYHRCLDNLIASMKNVGIEHYFASYEDHQGSWEKNCQYKARVLRRDIDRTESPIVWVDADAEFMAYPHLFETLDCDVGFYYYPRTREFLSGTVFLNNTPQVRAFLDMWIAENDKNDRWDQVNMKNVLSQCNWLNVRHLPVEYCKIFDNVHQQCVNPVIVHNQASRQAKRIVNGRGNNVNNEMRMRG